MANSTFPIPIGPRGSSNARVLNGLRSGRIPYAAGFRYFHRFRVRAADITGEADTDQTIDLNALYPANAFPANVKRHPAWVNIHAGIGGGSISDATIEVGDGDDPNGLLTSTPAFEGDDEGEAIATPAAAEYTARPETAYAPTLRIQTTDGNTNAIDTMDIEIVIPFTPLPA